MFSLRCQRLGKGLAAAFSLVLALGVMLQACWSESLRPGTEVFAVDPEVVLEVSYRNTGVRLLAHRWRRGEPFTLVFWEKGRPRPASCPAGQGFTRVLKELTSLKLQRTLTAREQEECLRSQPLSAWAELVIRDTSALEPFRAQVLPGTGAGTGALVHFHGRTYLVDLNEEVFNLISGGCKILGVPDGPARGK